MATRNGTSVDPIEPIKATLLEQILGWSEQSLPDWQRDALRRLFQHWSTELAPADFAELFLLMKKNNGIAILGELVAKPWAKEHLPNTAANNQHAILTSMHNLKFVNRIVEQQVLMFSAQGMTVVYGGNGSGKSGYTRVLKRACRARDQTEAILTDATNPAHAGNTPTATFDIEIEGQSKSVTWTLNNTPPDELATVAVFDGKCARAYLTIEGDVAYIPYGLDVIGSLANKVLPELERMLATEIEGLDVDVSVLEGLKGTTAVGALIGEFGAQTDQKELERLALVTNEQLERLQELQKTLAEDDPMATAKKVRIEIQRLVNLTTRIIASCDAVSEKAALQIKKLDDENVVARKAVDGAAELLRSGEAVLPGTGADLWRRMFEAARKYSLEDAYPGKSFPHLGEDSACPLCQQSIADVGERLKRFEDFVQQDASKVAAQAKTALENAVATLQSADFTFQIDSALTEELTALDSSLPQRAKTFGDTLDIRKSAIVTATLTHDWGSIPDLGDDVNVELSKHAKSLAETAEALEKAADGEKRKTLVIERNELQAKVSLKLELKKASKLLSNLKTRAELEGCRKDLKTTGISTKAKAFSESAVSGTLRDALDQEFEKLGGVPFKLKLADRSDKGKTKYKLQMVTTTSAKLDEILSEGEQRAVAIGSFLAEIAVAGHKGGIIFDDPVSSLDHVRKGRISQRLAEEAKNRQVIVFTHDLAFLTMLQSDAESTGAGCCAHWLEKDVSGRPGRVKLDDSPAGSKAYRKTTLACASIKKAETLNGADRVSMLRQAAGQLRRTLEEIVQFHLFKEVVVRWRENLILTKLLSGTTYLQMT